jgi:hypothetical protein
VTTGDVGQSDGVVFFVGGPDWRRLWPAPTGQVEYTVPKGTLDPRFSACTDHHVACDCREACLREDIDEARADYKQVRDAIGKAIYGHDAETCQCGACGIARDLLLSHLSTMKEYRP